MNIYQREETYYKLNRSYLYNNSYEGRSSTNTTHTNVYNKSAQ